MFYEAEDFFCVVCLEVFDIPVPKPRGHCEDLSRYNKRLHKKFQIFTLGNLIN